MDRAQPRGPLHPLQNRLGGLVRGPRPARARQWIGAALLSLKARRAPLQRLSPISCGELLSEMKRATDAVGCAVLRPTPHGLRHGGASHDKALGLRTLGEIQSRGKWRSPLSAQRYEKHARISDQLEELDPRVLRDLQ